MYKDNSLTLHINLHPHKKPQKVAKMDISWKNLIWLHYNIESRKFCNMNEKNGNAHGFTKNVFKITSLNMDK